MIIEIFHNNPSIKTLGEFAAENGVVIDSTFTIQNLLEYEGNAQRIQQAYIQNPTEVANVNRLESPTLIKVPSERIQQEFIPLLSNNVVANRDFKVFFDQQIKNIIQNPQYKPLANATNSKTDFTLRKIHNNVTVWMWCRALGDEVEPGRLINMTPFVDSVTINNAEQGGNFTIRVVPLKSEYIDGEGWAIDQNTISQYFYNEIGSFLSRVPTTKIINGEVVWQEYFFNNVISSNDVVFIQFETLESELERQNNVEYNLFISTEKLAGRNFDMIGLVDQTTFTTQPASSSVDTTVSGRDLMKLLIEDGCYFFPLDFASENGGFVNTTSNNPSFKRLVNGELSFFNAYVDRSIEFSLKFIFNILTNIKVCDTRLFQHYEKQYRYDTVDIDGQKNSGVSTFTTTELKKIPVQGIWNCVRLTIDPEISQRRIVDSSISTDSGSLLNFVHKVCQDPFVEFYGETFGDKYYFIARKHPFTGKAIKSYIKQNLIIDIEQDVIQSFDSRRDDAEVYSWYRLTPRGNFFGDSNGISLLQFPAVFFEEYAEIWGSRPLSIVSNYIDYNYLSNSNNRIDLDYLTKQSTQDLSYIVETHAYLPFTRTGTITILGDRRIKKGMFVRVKPTGEIYYVKAVSHSWQFNESSNDRSTTLIIERGMVEKYMDQTQKINYFNIIDLRKDKEGKSKDSAFKVNKEVFDFFNKNLQYVSDRNTRNLIS